VFTLQLNPILEHSSLRCSLCGYTYYYEDAVREITQKAHSGILVSRNRVKHSKSFDVGVLALLHPSNPESRRYYRAFMADGRMLYEHLLEEIAAAEVEGVVLGLHPDLADEEIQHVRKAVGDEKIILFQVLASRAATPSKPSHMGDSGYWSTSGEQ
jgi:hypothetical protein